MTSVTSHSSRVFSMASGTLVSRLTGLLRVLVLAWVFGFTPIADAFNLANTVPNMLFDLVLGGVASATFIPVFIERLSLDGERKAWRSISSVITGSLVVLFSASVLAWIFAPWIIDGFTALNHPRGLGHISNLHQQRALATSLLRWFIPQIFFYGIIGIATALLNIRNKFAPGSWVPVINNLVCIVVLVWFHLVDPTPTLSNLNGSGNLVWLGLGTTCGVVLQFMCLLPSLAKSDLGRVTFNFNFRDPVVRTVARLGSWTLLVVVANQLSLYIVLAFAFGIGGGGPVSAYTYGWSFMQMPYAVIVVSVLSALTPQLSKLASDKDFAGFAERLRFGLRQSLVIIVPCTIGLVLLSQPLVGVLLNHVHAEHRLLAGSVLAVLGAGLPGFTVFQVCIRGLQAMQRARDVFYLYALQNGLTVLLAMSIGRHSMSGLCASVSISYSAIALVGLANLTRHQVSISATLWSKHVLRSVLASVASGIVIAMAYASSTASSGFGLLTRFGASALLGVLMYLTFIVIWQRNAVRNRKKSVRLDKF